MYSFVNRFKTGLEILELEVLWDTGLFQGDPNKFAIAGCRETIELGHPIAVSDLSGKPAYVYRSSNIELGLTKDELYRFLRKNLDPNEQQLLLEKFGDFYEISQSFYTEDGVAWQPKKGINDDENFFSQCMKGEVEPEEIDKHVEKWHTSNKDISLHHFLGMRVDEYNKWVINPESIFKSLFERMRDNQL